MSGWPADAPFQWGDTVKVSETIRLRVVVGLSSDLTRVWLDGFYWVHVADCTLVKPDVIVWRNIYATGVVLGEHASRSDADLAALYGRSHVLEYNKTYPNKSVLHDVRGDQ